MSRVLQFALILGADVVSSGLPNVQFGMLVALTLVSWENIERSTEFSEHKQGDLGLQAWIFVDSK